MYISPELKARVNAKLAECAKLATLHYGRSFAVPAVTYDIRGTTAGRARSSQYLIRLNGALFLQNVEGFLDRTIPHEFAHLVDAKLNPQPAKVTVVNGRLRRVKRDVHGDNWREICGVIGMTDITRCHSYDVSTTKINKPKRRTIEWKCTKCDHVLLLTPKMSLQLANDPYARYHRGCRGWPLQRVSAAQGPSTPAAPQTLQAAIADVPEDLRAVLAQVLGTPAVSAAEGPKPPAAQPSTGSKIDACKQLYLKYSMLSRGEIIAKFISQAGCTPAGAGTYYATCKKIYG